MKSKGKVLFHNRYTLIAAFILFSGMSGLTYELLWERILSITFGATASSLSMIVTSYMAGLALGSFLFGRLVDKYPNPIRLFASLQIGIGVSVIVLPLIFARLQILYATIYSNPSLTPYHYTLTRLGLSFLLLLVPTTLLGGSLPILSKSLITSSERLGRNVGILYGMDTLGAVIGCFVTGFLLIQTIGTRYTMYFGSSVSFVLGGGALLLSLREHLPGDANAKKKDTVPNKRKMGKTYPASVIYLVFALFALSGLCALSYEVLWTRILVLFLRSTTYAFAMILIVFLSGLSLGSFLFSRLVDNAKSPLSLLGAVELGIGTLAMATLFLFGHFRTIVNAVAQLTGTGSWHQIIAANFIASFAIILLPAVLMGATFPIMCKICTRSVGKLGRYVGGIYSVNTIGAILGGLLTGFFLIPLLGIQKTLALVTLVSVAIGIVFLGVDVSTRRRSRLVVLSVFLPLILIGQGFMFIQNQRILLNVISHRLGALDKVLFYKEASEGIVSVVEKDGVRLLFTNTDVQGDSSYLGQRIQKRQGYIPILLHQNETLRDILVVGLGTGMTVGALAEDESVESVDCVEIIPGVVDALEYFAAGNNRVFENPKVKLYVGDGRSLILSKDKVYDAIVIDLIFPDNAGAGNMYSKDFYQLCAGKIEDSGLVMQWIPLFQLSLREFRIVANTFRTAFPHSMLWAGWIDGVRPIVALVGAKKPLKLDFELLQQKIAGVAINEKLENVGLGDSLWVLSYFLMAEDGLSSYAQGAPINTDDYPLIEFSTPRTSWLGAGAFNIIDLFENRGDVIPLLVNLPNEDRAIIKEKLTRFRKAQEYYLRGRVFALRGLTENEIQEYEKALLLYPEDRDSQYWLEQARSKSRERRK